MNYNFQPVIAFFLSLFLNVESIFHWPSLIWSGLHPPPYAQQDINNLIQSTEVRPGCITERLWIDVKAHLWSKSIKDFVQMRVTINTYLEEGNNQNEKQKNLGRKNRNGMPRGKCLKNSNESLKTAKGKTSWSRIAQ